MKFSMHYGVSEVKGSQVVARECYYTSTKECEKMTLTSHIETLDTQDEDNFGHM